ncbi:MAG: hypothetical protein NZ781_11420 [Armatimonadetes bacterium]|nr:hypothetical protein [Armatimonadota bacterium]
MWRIQFYVHDFVEELAAALLQPPELRRRNVGAEALIDQQSWTWQELLRRQPMALSGTPLASLPEYEQCNNITGWSFYHRWLTANY